MNVLYVLERPPRDAETFIRREIREVMRQGVSVRAAYPAEVGWRVEGAETFLDLAPPGAAPGRLLPPPSAAAALVRALAISPGGARRARAHAEGPGRGLGSGFRQAVALAVEARRSAADALHAHFADRACEDAMLASLLSGIPFTFTTHGYDVNLAPPPDLAHRAEAAAAVIAVSEATARRLAQERGVPASKVRVIPCGVDVERFRPTGEREPDLAVAVLRLHPDKGPDLLVEAALSLAASQERFRLEVIGDGPMRAPIESRLRAAPPGAAARIALRGAAAEGGVLEALRRASVFVLPSRTEAMPVALMEAMACGVACVATDVGGVAELLEDGRCGLLVPAENPRALAEGIADLLEDPERRRSLGAAGRERVAARYRLDASVAALREIWKAAAAERARAR